MKFCSVLQDIRPMLPAVAAVFVSGCTNDSSEIENAIEKLAEAMSFEESVSSLAGLQRATSASNAFAKDVTFLGRGANDTEARRKGNALVKSGALAAFKHFKKLDVDVNTCVTRIVDDSGQAECGVRVTAQDADSGDYFRESNRIKFVLQKTEGRWRIRAAENLDPLSFELGSENGDGE